MANLVWELTKAGSQLTIVDLLAAYVLPIVLFTGDSLSSTFQWNALCQVLWFLVIVQIPGLLTGKMSYVDIGWPSGLVILGVNGILYGEGYSLRKWLVGGCMVLHGLRMFLGALVMFFPYTFPNGDLPRYQFAKKKWVEMDGLPVSWWWLKQQQETMSQCAANCIVLATPILIACANPHAELETLEFVGLLLWGAAWAYENLADVQKQLFLQECKTKYKQARTPEEKAEIKNAVLGYSPYDGRKYWCWTLHRHPNYFGEYACWVSYCVLALPSVLRLYQESPREGIAAAVGLVLVCRFFYDCLVYWTGAGPAEYGSVQKRPLYREYQAKVPVFLPCELPLFPSHKVKGWPYPNGLKKAE